MSNEKQTDPSHWKNRLSDLDSIPGEAFINKDAAWELLHNRLHEKPNRNKAIWYWAAACLLLLIALPLLLIKRTNTNLPGREMVQQKLNPPAPSADNLVKKETAVIISNNKTITEPVKSNTVKRKNNYSGITSKPAIIYSMPREKPAVTIFSPSIAAADSTALVNITTPVKKKLNVVNINELDAPTVQEYMAQTKKYRDFRIEIGKEKNLKKASAYQKNLSFQVLLQH